MSEVKRCPTCGNGNLTKVSKENGSIETVCNSCGVRHLDESSRGIE